MTAQEVSERMTFDSGNIPTTSRSILCVTRSGERDHCLYSWRHRETQ